MVQLNKNGHLIHICFALLQINHTLRTVKAMPCALDSDNAADDSILELDDILKVNCSKMRTCALLWLHLLHCSAKKGAGNYVHHHNHQHGRHTPCRDQHQQSKRCLHLMQHHQDHPAYVCVADESSCQLIEIMYICV